MIDWSVAWKGTKLIDRIDWAKNNLKPVQTDYCVVYESLEHDCAIIMNPSANYMAALMHGNLIPPAWVKLQLKEDERRPDFTRHSDFNGHLLHETKPMGPLTEEQAIEYLIVTDIEQEVWSNYDKGNRQRMAICRRDQLPTDRTFRDAWAIDVQKDKEMSYV